jgi:hypothetical protein
MFSKAIGAAALSGVVLAALAVPQAKADYYTYHRHWYGDAYGDALRGAAAAIDAQGRFLIDAQRARLFAQDVERAKLETQRRQIEFWLWKRSILPTLADIQERDRREQVRQAQLNPPVTEILSGKSLNDLLADIQILQARGYRGPDVGLDEATLAQINVLLAGSAGNPGLLKAPRLDWPLLLNKSQFKEDRERIEALMARAASEAKNGPVPAGTVEELQDAIAQAKEKVKDLLHTIPDEDVPSSQFVRANRFLTQLKDTSRVLEEPEAGGYLTGKYKAQGKTVAELVQNMTGQGLKFAAAAGGNDGSYVAVHRALAAYDVALQRAAGVTLPDRSGAAGPG